MNKSKTYSPSAVGLDELDTGVLECLLDADDGRHIPQRDAFFLSFDTLNRSDSDTRTTREVCLLPS